MGDLMIGLLSALIATNPPVAVSNLIAQKTGVAVSLPDLNDPVEREYRKLLQDDDDAQTAVNQWIKEKQALGEDVAEVEVASLRLRAQRRLEEVKHAYEDFLKRHPNHARARLAYGSFLNDIQEEEAARIEWEKAKDLDPTEPAAWNNLANWYAHNSPVEKAFEYYGKALDLRPQEATYYENLAIVVYMFRRDATNFYKITEAQVFDKAMGLYRRALELDPENFILATQYAQSFYGFRPPRFDDPEANRKAERNHFEEAMNAWRRALRLARDDIEREGVVLHFARLQINAGHFAAARANLDQVTNAMYAGTRSNLTRKLLRLEHPTPATNAGPTVVPKS
jgi:tetratricopeptide (TPR) repeat protein